MLKAIAFACSLIFLKVTVCLKPQQDFNFSKVHVPMFNCTQGIRVRKEFRDLTKAEWDTFKNTLISLYSMPKALTDFSELDYWTGIHWMNVPEAHKTAQFFPWHRIYLKMFEDKLRTLNPEITLPYWDWTKDAQRPLKSPIFRPAFLGFVKRGSAGDCRFRVRFPKAHCLVRNYVPATFPAYYSQKAIAALLKKAANFDMFAKSLELAPHAIVHPTIGGKGGDMTGMMSPNDPFFWLHHTFLDKLWDDWQKMHPKNFQMYNGKHRKKNAGPADIMKPWGIPVSSTFNVTSFCYAYKQTANGSTSSQPSIKIPDSNPIIEQINNEFKLPSTVPADWLKHHGFEEKEFRKSENALLEIMKKEHAKEVESHIKANTSNAVPSQLSFASLFICIFVLSFLLRLL